MFSQALADLICKQLATGKSLRAICRDLELAESTVRMWEADPEKTEFAAQSTRAREIGCHSMADECLDIADERADDVQRSRLRIDTRLRLLGKWMPKVYGEKSDLSITGIVKFQRIESVIVDPESPGS